MEVSRGWVRRVRAAPATKAVTLMEAASADQAATRPMGKVRGGAAGGLAAAAASMAPAARPAGMGAALIWSTVSLREPVRESGFMIFSPDEGRTTKTPRHQEIPSKF